MELNDLLLGKDIDPRDVLVLRHRPTEADLNRVFPRLAGERPDLFKVYEQVQTEKLEKTMAAMTGKGHLASFIAHGAGRAIFISLSRIAGSKPITFKQYWQAPANLELKALGMRGVQPGRSAILWFDLAPVDFYASWKGKLIVDWPPPERSWWRRAHKNNIPIHAILEDSALDEAMEHWSEIDLTWPQLRVLPARWKAKLSEWRAIYYIFDTSNGKGYVGAAYGSDNLLGRWFDYAKRGHGGNRLLRERDPQHFRFTILERVSPDMPIDEVIQLEATWKERLHTRAPFGLNIN